MYQNHAARTHVKTLVIVLVCCLWVGCARAQGDEGEEVNKLAEMRTPVFWAEGHPGHLDRESWTIEVTGLCENPRTFTWSDLMAMDKAIAYARLTSVTRWSVRGEWGGVRVADILDAVGVADSVRYVRFWSVGEYYDTSIPIEIARKERTLLAWEYEGQLLSEDYGGPVRVFCPYLWGYKSAKSVVRIELMSYYVPGFWEQRGYTDDAEIEPGPMRDMNDGGKIKRITGGEVKEFVK